MLVGGNNFLMEARLMNNSELRTKWDESKINLVKQTKCFGNVPSNDPNHDTYCEEMQGALEKEERYWKKAEGKLY